MSVTSKLTNAAIGLSSAIALASAAQAAEYTLKIGHVSAVTQPLSTCAEVMKSHVERYSGGRI
ncbi:hypothetical protein, partial [uncultured Sulfitobacter sp.]